VLLGLDGVVFGCTFYHLRYRVRFKEQQTLTDFVPALPEPVSQAVRSVSEYAHADLHAVVSSKVEDAVEHAIKHAMHHHHQADGHEGGSAAVRAGPEFEVVMPGGMPAEMEVEMEVEATPMTHPKGGPVQRHVKVHRVAALHASIH